MNKLRRSEGHSLIELIAGLVIVIPIVLLAVDLSVLFMASTNCATASSNAGRAAADGPPSLISPGTPQKRADAAVKQFAGTQGAFWVDPNVSISENVQRPLPTAPYGGPVHGSVTAKTTTYVKPPFLIGRIVKNGCITLQSESTYPYAWVMDATIPLLVASKGPSSPVPNGGKPPAGTGSPSPATPTSSTSSPVSGATTGPAGNPYVLGGTGSGAGSAGGAGSGSSSSGPSSGSSGSSSGGFYEKIGGGGGLP